MSRPHKHPKSSIPWFRISVPKDLRGKIGKSEIKQSLGTNDPNEAQIQLARLTAEWKSRFQALRNETVADDLARAPELVDEFLKQLADRRHGDLDGAIYALQKLIAVRALTAWGPSEYYGRGANVALGYDPDPSMWENWETDPDPLADLIPEDERNALIEPEARLLIVPSTVENGNDQRKVESAMRMAKCDAVMVHIVPGAGGSRDVMFTIARHRCVPGWLPEYASRVLDGALYFTPIFEPFRPLF